MTGPLIDAAAHLADDASYPESMLYGHRAGSPRHARPRHLRLVRQEGHR